MRRNLVLFCTLLSLPLLFSTASGKGLYVGHGLRSIDHAWTARLNVSGGLHGAQDALVDDWDDDWGWNEFGGYGQAGLELRLGRHAGLELYAGYREVDDSDRFRLWPSYESVLARYDLEALYGGVTLRQYQLVRRGAAYWGVGVGIVQAESRYQEVVSGDVQDPVEAEDTGGELHLLVGFESYVTPAVGLGLELGYRFSSLDEGTEFTGAFVGLRLGFLLNSR